jgi:hypothetical protein
LCLKRETVVGVVLDMNTLTADELFMSVYWQTAESCMRKGTACNKDQASNAVKRASHQHRLISGLEILFLIFHFCQA